MSSGDLLPPDAYAVGRLLVGYHKHTNTVAINVEGAQINVSIQQWHEITAMVEHARTGSQAPEGETVAPPVNESSHRPSTRFGDVTGKGDAVDFRGRGG